jgi:hypothetical protein
LFAEHNKAVLPQEANNASLAPVGSGADGVDARLDVTDIIIIINPCKPYLTASAPRLTHWGGGK